MTSYTIDGIFQLTHPGEIFPEQDRGTLKKLKADAASLGYELKRVHGRSKLKHYILPFLEQKPHSELNSIIGIDEDARSYRDHQSIYISPYAVDENTVETLERLLPDFLLALKDQEGIDANVDLKFADREDKKNTIRLRWLDGELKRTEEAVEPVERITYDELLRRQAAGELPAF